ncbi:5-hydroxyisourate hydrolase [Vanrija pseudolonga]|uniref:5-hydroxyisourate hydrolase n=1 Tax=Vanrija pseudolonga TaxID=143232 RepID=A0AAF0YGB2_9TREE|nr:5-hydroxyisourate hydrolase [Vanrija pseudolonga]
MAKSSPITCHVLDASIGKPAQGVAVRLSSLSELNSPHALANGVTDADGRCSTLLDGSTRLNPGLYRMTFLTQEYFIARGVETFYPVVEQLTLLLALFQITFNYVDPTQHYHVPLLMSPFSYTTYRGS